MSDPKYEKLIERTKEGRFPKGVSGNPTGRPKTRSLSKAYRDKLEEAVPNDPNGSTFAQLIADAMVHSAMKGDVSAACELADRVEGKVKLAVAETDDEFAEMSVEELEAELERTRAERSAGETPSGTPPEGGYTN